MALISPQGPHRVGILLRDGWTKASLVPIPLKAHIRDHTEDNAVTVACLDVEEWVRCPTQSDRWSKHVSVSEAYALASYSSTAIPPSSRSEPYVEQQRIIVETISDVLFLKIRDQTIVNVEDEDMLEVIQELELMF